MPGSRPLVAVAWMLFSAFGVAQNDRTQFDGVYTDPQAYRGERVYRRHCARCHGPSLEGIPQAVTYPGQSPRTPPLVGDEFIRNWSGVTLGAVLDRVRISMPQDQIGVLTRQQVADVVAFILQSGNYPSGAAELPANARDSDHVTLVREPR